MLHAWLLFITFSSVSYADHIELLQCEKPDEPIGGGYGPQQSTYLPGDFIHYYCETDNYIGGNFYRRCEDTGDWSGDTPVCDAPSAFAFTSQSSTKDDESESDLAVDGYRTTCTSTIGGRREEWSGTFLQQGQLIRVMLFLPKGRVSYEVVLVKPNGAEIKCGSQVRNIDRYEWTFHNCPEPHNTGASGLKIRSLSNEPLKICEIVAHVLTSPKCVDPHFRIESGHLRLSRKTAVLVCENGYKSSRHDRLDCIREGVWDRKALYCYEEHLFVEGGDGKEPVSGPKEPERERFKDKKKVKKHFKNYKIRHMFE